MTDDDRAEYEVRQIVRFEVVRRHASEDGREGEVHVIGEFPEEATERRIADLLSAG